MAKIYWLSRHDLSSVQVRAIRELHGKDVEVVKDPVVFTAIDGLADYIREHRDGLVYVVAGTPHCIAAALAGSHFGVFENAPQKRQDGSFGLAGICLVNFPWKGELEWAWINPDPASDEGEALTPVLR